MLFIFHTSILLQRYNKYFTWQNIYFTMPAICCSSSTMNYLTVVPSWLQRLPASVSGMPSVRNRCTW